MSLFGKFPTYETHAVHCFKCSASIQGTGELTPDHNPPGHGAYKAYCSECKMSTWYDIEPQGGF